MKFVCVRCCQKCYQPAIVTVSLEGGGADKLRQNFKFGIYPRNYLTHCDNSAWRGPEPRDSLSCGSFKP